MTLDSHAAFNKEVRDSWNNDRAECLPLVFRKTSDLPLLPSHPWPRPCPHYTN